MNYEAMRAILAAAKRAEREGHPVLALLYRNEAYRAGAVIDAAAAPKEAATK